MKVIGAGLPRTATTTQMVAFEMLGFGPCYHMRNVLGDLENELPHWEAALEGNADWDAVFGDCPSTCDFPSSRYYAELMEYYPEAKFVLTVRSPEGWVKSMRETVWGIFHGDSVLHHMSDARTCVDENWRRFITMMRKMNWEENGAMAGDTYDDQAFGKIMERWNDQVKSTIPSDRLLVWDPKEGWDPLCEFLDVDVPDEPLPHLNDTQSFKEGIISGSLAAVGEWWEQRERPETGLHGAELREPA